MLSLVHLPPELMGRHVGLEADVSPLGSCKSSMSSYFGLKGCFHDLLQQKNTLHVRWVGDTGQHEAVACTPLHDFEAQSLCFEARLTTGIIACVGS